MNRGRARFVASEILTAVRRANGVATKRMLACSSSLAVTLDQARRPLTRTDLLNLRAVLEEGQRIAGEVPRGSERDALDETLRKADDELRLLGTAVALAESDE